MRSPARVIAGAMAVGIVFVGAAAAVSSAGASNPKSPKVTHMAESDEPARQEDLEAVADELQPTKHPEGFGGVAVDIADSRLDLWWKGDLPADVAAVVSRSGVRVDVHPAQFTDQELRDAAGRLVGFEPSDRSFTVDWAGTQELTQPTPENGLFVRITPRASMLLDVNKISQQISQAAGIPVVIDAAAGNITDKSREDDSAPSYDGSQMRDLSRRTGQQVA